MTPQLRKSHSSLEVDRSQMGKQVQRERKSDLPRPHLLPAHPPTQSCTGSSPGGQAMLTWMTFLERQELNGVLLWDH